jgi:hypothetical protein
MTTTATPSFVACGPGTRRTDDDLLARWPPLLDDNPPHHASATASEGRRVKLSRSSKLATLAIAVTVALLLPRPAPRPGHRPVEASVPPSQQVASVTDGGRTGAPLDSAPVPTAALADVPPVGVPPTSGLGDWSSARNPAYTAPPDRSGTATWWNSWGPGLYAALRPDLGTKGDLAIVCGGKPWHCLTLPVITTCACLGPGSDRLIDLSLDAFRSFADPSRGVVRVVVTVVAP